MSNWEMENYEIRDTSDGGCDVKFTVSQKVRIEQPTKNQLQIDQLKAENEKLLRTMRLHAGDICSLNNDVEYFRGLKEEAEDIECKIQAENKWLRKSLKQYGRHSDECRAEKYPEAWHCTCGLEQALAGKGSDK